MSPANHDRTPGDNDGVLSKDAAKTPFPASALFYVMLASGLLIMVGSVLAYWL